MIYFACGVSAFLFWALREHRRELETKQQTQTFSFLLVDNALNFLRPLLAVTLLYVALSLFVTASDTATIGLLRKYEHILDNTKSVLKHLKLTPVLSLWVLVIAFVFTLMADAIVVLRPYKGRIERIHSFLEKYHKWIGRVALVVTLLSSFTVFGGTISNERARLEVAIKDIREKGEGFRNSLEEELRTRVAVNLMHNLQMVPVNSRAVFAVYEEIDTKEEELVRKKTVSAEYEIRSPVTEQLSSDLRERNAKIEALVRDTEIATASQETPVRPYEASISKPKLDALRPEIERYVQESLRVAKQKLQTPLGSRIGTTLLKMIISERHIPALETLTAEIPIAGPLLSIFTDSIRKKTAILIGEAADRVAVKAFESGPLNLDTAVDASASEAAAEVLKSVSSGDLVDFGIHQTLAQASLAKIDLAQEDFSIRLEFAKRAIRERNDKLITELRTRNAKKKPLSPPETSLLIDDTLDTSLDVLKEVKFEEAVTRLVNKAEKLDDPLVANRVLSAIRDSISSGPLSSRASSLASVAANHFGGSDASTELKKMAAELAPIHSYPRSNFEPPRIRPPSVRRPPVRPRP